MTALFEAAPNRTCVVHVCVCGCYGSAGCRLASDESRKTERRGLFTSPVDKDFLLFSQLFARARPFCLKPITPSQREPNADTHSHTDAQRNGYTCVQKRSAARQQARGEIPGHNMCYSKGVQHLTRLLRSTETEESPVRPSGRSQKVCMLHWVCCVLRALEEIVKESCLIMR